MYKLSIRFNDGTVTSTEVDDIETARATGKHWLTTGRAIGFSIERIWKT